MSEVIHADFRKKQEDDFPLERVDIYECLRCKGDSFTIWADGKIGCHTCGSVISNLRAVYDKRPA